MAAAIDEHELGPESVRGTSRARDPPERFLHIPVANIYVNEQFEFQLRAL
jgi:hypothetical protein